MKNLIILALVLTIHLFEGKDYTMEVVTETLNNRRTVQSITLFPKSKFSTARQKELLKYINRDCALIVTENKIHWEKNK